MTVSSLPTPLEIEPAAAAVMRGGSAVTFRHGLPGHPLLTRAALTDIAKQLPDSWARCYGGSATSGPPPAATEALTNLEHGELGVRLLHLELTPGYRALLAGIIAEFDRRVGLPERSPADGLVFMSSPGVAGPLHCDHHHNLLLQVQGVKEVTLGGFADPQVAQRQIEDSLGAATNATATPTHSTTVRLGPGDGLYIPPFIFHGVRVLDEVSIALSCAVSTKDTRRDVLIHSMNHRLRRWGLPATAPGRSVALDRAKMAAVHLSRRLRNRPR